MTYATACHSKAADLYRPEKTFGPLLWLKLLQTFRVYTIGKKQGSKMAERLLVYTIFNYNYNDKEEYGSGIPSLIGIPSPGELWGGQDLQLSSKPAAFAGRQGAVSGERPGCEWCTKA